MLERTTLQLFLFSLQLQTSEVDGVTDHTGRLPHGRPVNFIELQTFAARARVCLYSKRVLSTTQQHGESRAAVASFFYFSWKENCLYSFLNWVSCQSLNSSLMFLLQKSEMITKWIGWYTAHAFPLLLCSFLPFLLLSHNYLLKTVPFEISFHSCSHLSSVMFVFTTVGIWFIFFSLLFIFFPLSGSISPQGNLLMICLVLTFRIIIMFVTF